MAKIVFDIQTISCMSLFEKITRARLKDCIMQENDNIVFIVENGEIAKAIGKQGVNVKKLEKALNKRIKIVEFNEDLEQFIRNLVAPLKVEHVVQEDEKVILTAKDLKTRGLLIGRNASHLRGFEAIIQRYFPIQELRVN